MCWLYEWQGASTARCAVDLTFKSVRARIMDSHEHGMQIHRVCWMPRRALLERLRALLLMVAVQLSIVTESPGDQIGRDY